MGESASFLRVAHRGAPKEAPENTLAAFRAALAHGVDGIELDVRFSRDDRPMVHHDRDLARTAERSERVADLDREVLVRLDVGSWFDSDFAGETVPDLSEALGVIAPAARAYVEVKDGPTISDTAASRLASALRDGADGNTLMVVSYHEPVLVEMKARIPHLRTGLLLSQTEGDPVDRLATCHASALFLRHDAVEDEVVGYCARGGYSVFAWTVDDLEEMRRVLVCDVVGIISNRPELFSQV